MINHVITNKENVSARNRLLAVLCYVGFIIVPIIVKREVSKEGNPFLFGHASQALEFHFWAAYLVFFAATMDYVINQEILDGLICPFVRFFAGVCIGIAVSGCVILSVIASCYAINGEEHEFTHYWKM